MRRSRFWVPFLIGVAVVGTSVPRVPPATARPSTRQPAISPGTVEPRHWNLAADFLAHPGRNPGPDAYGNRRVWSYRESSSLARDGNYPLLPNFSRTYHLITGYKAWFGSDFSACGTEHGDLPTVSINTNSSDIEVCGSIRVPSEAVDVHPFANHMAIIGWKSPVSGRIHITGSIEDLDANCGNGIRWFLEHGAATLARGTIRNGRQVTLPTGLSPKVASGDDVFLLIAPRDADFYCDSTRLLLSIAG